MVDFRTKLIQRLANRDSARRQASLLIGITAMAPLNQLEGSELLIDGHIRPLVVDTAAPYSKKPAVNNHGYKFFFRD